MKNKVNEYYLAVRYENHFVDHDMFFSIVSALDYLRIPYKRAYVTDFRDNGDDYDIITRCYLYTDFNFLFHVIKAFNEKKQTSHL